MISTTINVSKQELMRIARIELDYISDNYHDGICEMAGWNTNELIDSLILDTRFQTQVLQCVREYGQGYLDDPYDYNSGLHMPEFTILEHHLADIKDILNQASIDEDAEKTELAKAMKLVQSFGYSVL